MEDEYEFLAEVLNDGEAEAGYMSRYVRVPDDVAAAFEEAGVTKVVGTLDLTEFRRTLHRSGDGGRVLKFGRSWLSGAEAKVGDEVLITLREDPFPDRVELPVEFEELLTWEPEAQAVWEAKPPGKRRTLAYQIARGKKEETRQRRAQKLLAELLKEAEAASD